MIIWCTDSGDFLPVTPQELCDAGLLSPSYEKPEMNFWVLNDFIKHFMRDRNNAAT